jgi:hypothetical protein
MNKILTLIFVILLVSSCSKEETKLELFNPEAFAYDLGDSWEVNAIVNLKGFVQKENNSEKRFEASISLSTDLETPDGKIIKDIYSDQIDYALDEEIIDMPIEVQFELDSTFTLGKYEIKIFVKDNFARGEISGVIYFDLSD